MVWAYRAIQPVKAVTRWRLPTMNLHTANKAHHANNGCDPARKPTLFSVPHRVLPDSFYTSPVPPNNRVHSPLFTLHLRPLSKQVVFEINNGPPWLRGNYPPGLLEKRHEKRIIRPPVSGWRNVEDEDEPAQQKKVFPQTREPLLGPTVVPVIIIPSKKRIDKRAVKRNKVRTRLAAALNQVIETSPLAQQLLSILHATAHNSNCGMLVLWPTDRNIIDLDMSHLCLEVEKALARLIHNVNRQSSRHSTQGRSQLKHRPTSVSRPRDIRRPTE